MRKALIGFIVAAAAVVPTTSALAEHGGWDRQDRADGQQPRAQHQEQRPEGRQDRSFERAQRFAGQQQPAFVGRQRFDGQNAQTFRGQNFARPERNFNRPQPVFAQSDNGDARREEHRGDWHGQDQRGRWQGQGNGQWNRGQTYQQNHEGSNGWNGNRQWNGGQSYQGDRQGGNWNGNRQWNGNGGNWNRDRDHNWNRNWRNDNRYDWRRYRNEHSSIYRTGRYYPPYRGYAYRRFSVGLFLEPMFFSQRYWISDPWYYRLPPAYAGTEWVRYYDDALLVDVYTGEVVDVIYDFFW